MRITKRCLADDLPRSAASFEELAGQDIVKAFVRERSKRPYGSRQVTPLTSGMEVWVLAHGNDHRGGTWFDEKERVIWLLAYRRHRSGSPDDFFPHCKELDRRDVLLPTPADYKCLFEDRGTRFAHAVRLEAPLLLKQAREDRREHEILLGGELGARIAIEVAGDLEGTTIAFRTETVIFDYVPIILAAFHGDSDWESASAMPSRPLEPGEFAFSHLHEGSSPSARR